MDELFDSSTPKGKPKPQATTPSFNPGQMINPSARKHFKDQIAGGQGSSDAGSVGDMASMAAKRRGAQQKQADAQADAIRKAQQEELKSARDRRNFNFEQAASRMGRDTDTDPTGFKVFSDSDESFAEKRKAQLSEGMATKRKARADERKKTLDLQRRQAEFQRDDKAHAPLSDSEREKMQEERDRSERFLRTSLGIPEGESIAQHSDKAPERIAKYLEQDKTLTADNAKKDRWNRFNDAARTAEARQLGLQADEPMDAFTHGSKAREFDERKAQQVQFAQSLDAERKQAYAEYEQSTLEAEQRLAQLRQGGVTAADLGQATFEVQKARLEAQSKLYDRLGSVTASQFELDEAMQDLELDYEELDARAAVQADPDVIAPPGDDAVMEQDRPADPEATSSAFSVERLGNVVSDSQGSELGTYDSMEIRGDDNLVLQKPTIIAKDAASAGKLLQSDQKDLPVYMADTPTSERKTDEQVAEFEEEADKIKGEINDKIGKAHQDVYDQVRGGEMDPEAASVAFDKARKSIIDGADELDTKVTAFAGDALTDFAEGRMSAQQLNRVFKAAGQGMTGVEAYHELEQIRDKEMAAYEEVLGDVQEFGIRPPDADDLGLTASLAYGIEGGDDFLKEFQKYQLDPTKYKGTITASGLVRFEEGQGPEVAEDGYVNAEGHEQMIAAFDAYQDEVHSFEKDVLAKLKENGITGDAAWSMMRRAAYDGYRTRVRDLGEAWKESELMEVVPFFAGAWEAKDIIPIAKTAWKMENNEEVSAEELDDLESWIVDSSRESSWGADVFGVVKQLPSFAGELALTGGVYTAGRKMTMKGVIEALERHAKHKGADYIKKRAIRSKQTIAKKVVKEGMTDKAKSKAVHEGAEQWRNRAVSRWAGRRGVKNKLISAGGAVVGASMQSIPAGATRIPALALRDYATQGLESGKFELTTDELGDLDFVVNEEMPGPSVGGAMAHALTDNWVEVVSEHSGGVFDVLARPLKTPMMKLGIYKAFSKLNGGMGPSGFRKVLRRVGWNGILQEVGEERIGEMMRGGLYAASAGHLGEAYQLPTLRQISVELAAFAIPGGPVAALNEGIRIAKEAPAKHRIKTAEAKMDKFLSLNAATKAHSVNKRLEGDKMGVQFTPPEIEAGEKLLGGDIAASPGVRQVDEAITQAEAGYERAKAENHADGQIGYRKRIADLKEARVEVAMREMGGAAAIAKGIDIVRQTNPGGADFVSGLSKIASGSVQSPDDLTKAEQAAILPQDETQAEAVDFSNPQMPIILDEAREAALAILPSAEALIGMDETEARQLAKKLQGAADQEAAGGDRVQEGSDQGSGDGGTPGSDGAVGGAGSKPEGAGGPITVRGQSEDGKTRVAVQVPEGTSDSDAQRELTKAIIRKTGNASDTLNPNSYQRDDAPEGEAEANPGSPEGGSGEAGGATGGGAKAPAPEASGGSKSGEGGGSGGTGKADSEGTGESGAGGNKAGGSGSSGTAKPSGGRSAKDDKGGKGKGAGSRSPFGFPVPDRRKADPKGSAGDGKAGDSKKGTGGTNADDPSRKREGAGRVGLQGSTVGGGSRRRLSFRWGADQKPIRSVEGFKKALEGLQKRLEAAGLSITWGKISSGDVAAGNYDGILIDPEAMLKMGQKAQLTPEQQNEWILRVLSEELRHMALRHQIYQDWMKLPEKGRPPLTQFIEDYFTALYESDIKGSVIERAVNTAYKGAGSGSDTPAGVAEEGVRMVSQMMAEDTMTEEIRTWLAGASDKLKAAIRGVIELLRNLVSKGQVPAGVEAGVNMMEAQFDLIFGDELAEAEVADTDAQVQEKIIYASGLTASPARIKLAVSEGKPIGISLFKKQSANVIKLVQEAVNGGLHAFVDNGAFSTFKANIGREKAGKDPIEHDWERIFDDYEALLKGIDADKRHLVSIVAPDVVGDEAASVAIQAKYRKQIDKLHGMGATIIVPIQKGKADILTNAVDSKIDQGWDFSNPDKRYVIGVPFNAESWGQKAVTDLIYLQRQGTTLADSKGPIRIHLLGGGSSKVMPIVDYAEAEGFPLDLLSGDSLYWRAVDAKHKARDEGRAKKKAAAAKKKAINKKAAEAAERAAELEEAANDEKARKEKMAKAEALQKLLGAIKAAQNVPWADLQAKTKGLSDSEMDLALYTSEKAAKAAIKAMGWGTWAKAKQIGDTGDWGIELSEGEHSTFIKRNAKEYATEINADTKGELEPGIYQWKPLPAPEGKIPKGSEWKYSPPFYFAVGGVFTGSSIEAVEKGYFPISETGFRSMGYIGAGANMVGDINDLIRESYQGKKHGGEHPKKKADSAIRQGHPTKVGKQIGDETFSVSRWYSFWSSQYFAGHPNDFREKGGLLDPNNKADFEINRWDATSRRKLLKFLHDNFPKWMEHGGPVNTGYQDVRSRHWQNPARYQQDLQQAWMSWQWYLAHGAPEADLAALKIDRPEGIDREFPEYTPEGFPERPKDIPYRDWAEWIHGVQQARAYKASVEGHTVPALQSEDQTPHKLDPTKKADAKRIGLSEPLTEEQAEQRGDFFLINEAQQEYLETVGLMVADHDFMGVPTLVWRVIGRWTDNKLEPLGMESGGRNKEDGSGWIFEVEPNRHEMPKDMDFMADDRIWSDLIDEPLYEADKREGNPVWIPAEPNMPGQEREDRDLTEEEKDQAYGWEKNTGLEQRPLKPKDTSKAIKSDLHGDLNSADIDPAISKVYKIDGEWRVTSFGWRGETLNPASITQVASAEEREAYEKLPINVVTYELIPEGEYEGTAFQNKHPDNHFGNEVYPIGMPEHLKGGGYQARSNYEGVLVHAPKIGEGRFVLGNPVIYTQNEVNAEPKPKAKKKAKAAEGDNTLGSGTVAEFVDLKFEQGYLFEETKGGGFLHHTGLGARIELNAEQAAYAKSVQSEAEVDPDAISEEDVTEPVADSVTEEEAEPEYDEQQVPDTSVITRGTYLSALQDLMEAAGVSKVGAEEAAKRASALIIKVMDALTSGKGMDLFFAGPLSKQAWESLGLEGTPTRESIMALPSTRPMKTVRTEKPKAKAKEQEGPQGIKIDMEELGDLLREAGMGYPQAIADPLRRAMKALTKGGPVSVPGVLKQLNAALSAVEEGSVFGKRLKRVIERTEAREASDPDNSTQEQKEAENAPVGKIQTAWGWDISLETPKGAIRWKLDKKTILDLVDRHDRMVELDPAKEWPREIATRIRDSIRLMEEKNASIPEYWVILRDSINELAEYSSAGEEMKKAFNKAWFIELPYDYGRILKTRGADGDHLDVIIGEQTQEEEGIAYIVDQHINGEFDEHKLIAGYSVNELMTRDDARALWLSGFSDAFQPLLKDSVVHSVTTEMLNHWINTGDTSKPYADFAAEQEAVWAKQKAFTRIQDDSLPRGWWWVQETDGSGKGKYDMGALKAVRQTLIDHHGMKIKSSRNADQLYANISEALEYDVREAHGISDEQLAQAHWKNYVNATETPLYRVDPWMRPLIRAVRVAEDPRRSKETQLHPYWGSKVAEILWANGVPRMTGEQLDWWSVGEDGKRGPFPDIHEVARWLDGVDTVALHIELKALYWGETGNRGNHHSIDQALNERDPAIVATQFPIQSGSQLGTFLFNLAHLRAFETGDTEVDDQRSDYGMLEEHRDEPDVPAGAINGILVNAANGTRAILTLEGTRIQEASAQSDADRKWWFLSDKEYRARFRPDKKAEDQTEAAKLKKNGVEGDQGDAKWVNVPSDYEEIGDRDDLYFTNEFIEATKRHPGLTVVEHDYDSELSMSKKFRDVTITVNSSGMSIDLFWESALLSPNAPAMNKGRDGAYTFSGNAIESGGEMDWKLAAVVNAVFGEGSAERLVAAKATQAGEFDTAALRRLIWSDDSKGKKNASMKRIAKEMGVTEKEVNEAVELELVRLTHDYSSGDVASEVEPGSPPMGLRERYAKLRDLYSRQPILSSRTSTSKKNQAFSTPPPLAFALRVSLNPGLMVKVPMFEITAGNGMLMAGYDLPNSHANEINETRLANLKALGIGTVTAHDATDYVPDKKFPVVEANPPFGKLSSTTAHNGWGFKKLEHLISAQALDAMEDDGAGALILGAPMKNGERPGSGALRVFENYIYNHFNVVDNYEVDGQLYKNMGAAWPVHVIIVAGRRPNPGKVKLSPKRIDRLDNWEDIMERSIRNRDEVERIRQILRTGGAFTPEYLDSGAEANNPDGSGTGTGGNASKDGTGSKSGGSSKGGTSSDGDSTGSGSDLDAGSGEKSTEGGANDSGGNKGGGSTGPQLGGNSGGKSGGTKGSGSAGGSGGSGSGGSGGTGSDFGDGLNDLFGGGAGTSRLAGASWLDEFDWESVDDLVKFTTLPSDLVPTRFEEEPELPEGENFTGEAGDKFDALVSLAEKGMAEGIDTPAKLVELVAGLDQRVMTYLDAIWSGFLAVDPMLDMAPNWPELVKGHEVWTTVIPRIMVGDESFEDFLQQNPRTTWGHILASHAAWVEYRDPNSDQVENEDRKDEKPEREEIDGLDSGAIEYVARSKGTPFGTLIQRNLGEGIFEYLDGMLDRYGSIDKFVADRLNFSYEEMYQVLSADQIDGVALAIAQMEAGDALIIGDETGIGKGRQAAALIRYAILQGKIPVFFTLDAKLYTDMYNDLQDIHTTVTPHLMASDADRASIKRKVDEDMYETIHPLGTQPRQSRFRAQVRAEGWESVQEDVIFATYSQINNRGTTNGRDRQTFLEELANNEDVIIIMDESHMAAGDKETSMQAAFFMGGQIEKGKGDNKATHMMPGLLNSAGSQMGRGGVAYLSATYAKRADNMPVYFRTALRRAHESFDMIIAAMTKGGVALQQYISETLAGAGQYIRRERDFEGINYNLVTISLSEKDTAEMIEEVDNITEILREVISYSYQFIDAFESLPNEMKPTAMSESQHQTTEFASIVHNNLNQLLLAAKIDSVIDRAKAIVAKGEKPIIALTYTMGSFLKDFAEAQGVSVGEEIDITWQDLLVNALDRTMRVSEKDAQDNVTIHQMEPSMVDMVEEYTAIVAKIRSVSTSFPISPIDYMIQKLAAEGIVIGEMTGRDRMLQYDFKNGTTRYVKKEKADKNALLNDFNGGMLPEGAEPTNSAPLDGLLLNSAGSTGLSAHASTRFGDQRKRHMILAQPSADINVFVQTLGRIKRTGMVEMPNDEDGNPQKPAEYTHILTPLQAEIRPAAMTNQKMRSLNANTTSEAETAGVNIEVTDIINKYGDKVVIDFLDSNPDFQRKTRVHLRYKEDGTPASQADVAKKFMGRMSLQPDLEQQQVYAEIFPVYNAYIDQLKFQGDYDLDITVFEDWDAVKVNSEVLLQGTNEADLFESSVRADRYEVSDNRPIPSGEEMQAEFEANHKSPEEFRKQWDSFEVTTTNDLQARLNRLTITAADAAERLKGKQDANADWKAPEGVRNPPTPWDEEAKVSSDASAAKGRMEAVITRWNQAKRQFEDFASLYAGNVVTIRNNTTFETYEGMFTRVKFPDLNEVNPRPAAGRFEFQFTVNSPGGRLTMNGAQALSEYTIGVDRGKAPSDFTGKPEGVSYREQRYFITGNPVRGFAATLGRGNVVRFLTRDKEVITGILMPRSFTLDQLPADPRLQLNSPRAGANFLTAQRSYGIVFGNADVAKIEHAGYGEYRVSAYAAQRTGGRYYLDARLMELAGDFTKTGSRYVARISDPSILPGIIERMVEIGGNPMAAVGNTDKETAMAMVQSANNNTGAGTTSFGNDIDKLFRQPGTTNLDSVNGFGGATEPGDLGFVSAVEAVVRLKAQPVMTADHVRGILNPKRNPVKQAELDHLGIDDWLTENGPKIDKEELLSMIKRRNIPFAETVLGYGPEQKKAIETLERSGWDIEHDDYFGWRFEDRQGNEIDMSEIENDDRFQPQEDYEGNEIESAEYDWEDAEALIVLENSGGSKWDKYRWQGDESENYREILIQGPKMWRKANQKPFEVPGHWDDNEDILAHLRVDERPVDEEDTYFAEDKFREWLAGTKRPKSQIHPHTILGALNDKAISYDEFKRLLGDYGFTSSMEAMTAHNAQVREGNIRTALVLQELQSDWAGALNDAENEAKELQGEEGTANKEETIALLKEKIAKIDADLKVTAEDHLKGVDDPDGERFETEMIRLQDLSNDRAALEVKIHSIERPPPPMPFQKTYHQLAAKRLLAEAVKIGAQSIQWSTGKQQIDIYEDALRANIDEFTMVPIKGLTNELKAEGATEGSRYALIFIKKPDSDYDGDSSFWVNLDGKTQGGLAEGKRLHQIFGKKIAEEMKGRQTRGTSDKFNDQVGGIDIERTGSMIQFPTTYAGDDIRMGGNLHRMLYDTAIPSFFNRYTKKWGGRVTKRVPSYIIKRHEIEGETHFMVSPLSQNDRSADGGHHKLGYHATREEAVKAAEKAGHFYWELEITDQMREAIAGKPQPAFAGFLDMPEHKTPPYPPQKREMERALPANKRGKVYAHRNIPMGTIVTGRLDLPSMKKGVATQTVHQGTLGKVLGYDGALRLKGVNFVVREAAAVKIHEGGSKTPMAGVRGAYVPDNEIPNLEGWVPLRFNPKVHSYFFQAADGEVPVVAAAEAYLIENRVWVREPRFGQKQDFAFTGSILDPEGEFNEDDMRAIRDSLNALIGEAPDADRMETLREQAEQEKEGQRTIGDPNIANISGEPRSRRAYDAVRAFRDGELRADVQTQEEWIDEARRKIRADRAGVIRNLLDEMGENGSGTLNKWQIFAAQILINEIRAKAYAENSKEHHHIADVLSYGYQKAGSEMARAFGARRDAHKRPADRHLEYISNTLTLLNRDEERSIEEAWNPRAKQAALKPLLERIKIAEENLDTDEIKRLKRKIAKVRGERDQLEQRAHLLEERQKKMNNMLHKGYGVTLAEIFNGEAVVRLRGSRIVQVVMDKNFSEAESTALRMMVDGFGFRTIARTTGLHRTDKLPALRKKFQKLMRRRFTELVKAGHSLQDFLKEEDQFFVPIEVEARVPGTTELTEEQERKIDAMMDVIFLPEDTLNSGRVKKIQSARKPGKRKKGEKARPKKRFDTTNPDHTAGVLRTAQAELDGSAFDMAYEYWINNILSGPQTQVVNVQGNAFNLMFEYGIQRNIEAAVNLILRNKSATSFGEIYHMHRQAGLFSGNMAKLTMQALKHASRAWNSEMTFWEAEKLNDPTKAVAGSKLNEGRRQAIGDTFLGMGTIGGRSVPGAFYNLMTSGEWSGVSVGKTVRIAGRGLLFMDTFFKALIGQLEVHGQAYRIANSRGLTARGKEKQLEEFLLDQMAPGSEAWHGAVDKAQELTFTNPLRSWQDGGGSAEAFAKVVQDTRNQKKKVGPLGAFVLGLFIPFIQTPFRIFQAGLRRTPLGLLGISMFHANGFVRLHHGQVYIPPGMEARMVRDIADQVISWFMWSVIYSAVEGDGDDDDKFLLITGSHPYGVEGGGERDHAMRLRGGSYNIRVGGFHFDYGRIEPMAVTLGSIVDLIRSQKRLSAGAPLSDELGLMGHYFAAQATEKSFLKGMASIVEFWQDPNRNIKDSPKFFATAVVPNWIRQPMRNLDNYQRDYSTAPWYYHAFPMAMNADKKIDIFGNPVMKQKTPPVQLLGEKWDWADPWIRLLWDINYAAYDNANPMDRALNQWATDNPVMDERYYPTRNTKRTFKDANGEIQEMTGHEKEMLDRLAGKEFEMEMQMILDDLDQKVPTAETIKKIADARGKPWNQARDDIFYQGSRPQPPKTKPLSIREMLMGEDEE